ncbi:MAG: glycosyltransferase family 4 protein [Candidatus Marinimicrobia bacterium]|nr:glycosyltransferase family 4 protein [Candidatus Neomarinimicrobiota bacterium]
MSQIDSRKNFLFVNSIRKGIWGGGEKWMYEVGTGFRKKGYGVIYCGRPSSRFLSKAISNSFKYYPVDFNSDFNPITSYRLRKIVKEERIDVICLGREKELRLLAPVLWWDRKPSVIIRKGLAVIKNRLRFKIIYDRIVDAVITPSNALSDYLLETLPWLSAEKVKVLHNGVEIPGEVERGTFRKELGIGEHTFLAVVLGRLTPQKGHKFLFKALSILEHKIDGIQVVVVGEGAEDRTLRDQVDRLEIRHLVRFMGHRRDVSNILADCDLLIHPSRYEGMPNTVLEALAHGTPVLATDIPGVREIALREEIMAMVPPEDPEALAKSLLRLKSDLSYRQLLSRNGKKHVGRYFSLDGMIDGAEKIFLDTMK